MISLETVAAEVEEEMERGREMMKTEELEMKLSLTNSSSKQMKITRSSQAETMQRLAPISTTSARCATSGIFMGTASSIARTKTVTYLILNTLMNRRLPL
jgi:hypothetical protein